MGLGRVREGIVDTKGQRRSNCPPRRLKSLGRILSTALWLTVAAVWPAPAADVTAPAPVSGLMAVKASGDVNLAWSAVSSDVTGAPDTVVGYRVYRGTTPSFVPDRAGGTNRIGAPAATSFHDVGAAATPANYYYLVSAVDAAGNESATKPATVTVLPVVSGDWTETTIELTWTAAQPAEQVVGYRVYYGRAPRLYEFVADAGLTDHYTLTGLATNVFWYSAVTAVDVNGNESAFSNEHAEAVAGRGRVRAQDDDYLCWGASKCPPRPGAV